jgi:S-DNA-T family DNA segregation ATPase FtsK/SpoIIIE
VIFTLVSLVSFSPDDPSINHAGRVGEIENFFGMFGAQLSGFLVGLFGLGAFWLPVLFLIACVEFFSNRSGRTLALIAAGGVLLIVSTGSLLAFYKDSYQLFGHLYPAAGMIGLPLKAFLLKYSNWTGGMVILILFLLIGFILSTGVSLVASVRNFGKLSMVAGMVTGGGIKKGYSAIQEQREKRKTIIKPVKKRNIKIKEKKNKSKDEKKIVIKETLPPKPIRTVPVPKQQVFDSMRFDKGFQLPSLEYLKDPDILIDSVDHENLRFMSKILEQKLVDFGVRGKVVTVVPGPVITRFEFEPAPGIKINKVVNLSDDLALALRAISIRIIAPIPGKAVIGIEVPNTKREVVVFKDVVASQAFEKSKSKLTLGLGKDIVGNPVVSDLETMPHLLIAGATGSGKSVALNTMICSLLYKSTPDEVKLIMIDPKLF